MRRRSKILAIGLLTLVSTFVVLPAGEAAQAFGGQCCQSCCPPPPVTQELCVVDPCNGCSYRVCVTVPACCAEEAPCMVTWRRGIFGRKVLTYKWTCCGHCIDVVITKHGRTIVRG